MTKPNKKTFLPFDSHLDQTKILSILKTATDGADDGELFVERKKGESFLLQDGRLKSASYNSSEGFGLRIVRGETTGYSHSSDISEKSIIKAAETVRLAVGSGDGLISNSPAQTNQKLYLHEDPISDFNFVQKVEILQTIDAFTRELNKSVVQASVSMAADIQEISILRPDGLIFKDYRPMTRLSISVIVEKNGRRETGSAGYGGREGLKKLLENDRWKPSAVEAVRIANLNLTATPAPAGILDVVLGPGWPGILLHEAIGHGLEGDFNRKKTSAFCELMGTQIASRGVTILDDGTIPNRRGSISIDDEGTPSKKNVLIENGILVGYMQDRQNARLMGLKPTGNGRRESYAHTPLPRMTNTYMLSGQDNPKDILADLKDGVYAVGFGGGQVDITNGKFVFSCTEAYRVIGGKITNPVHGATIIGDGASALKKIRAIGNDTRLDPGIGNCGKAGQWVPVGVGQPTLLIGGLTVGGSKL